MADSYENMELFYELVQVALEQRECLSRIPSDEEWLYLFEESKKQAVAGVAFLALEKLSAMGQKPPLPLLYEWIAAAEQIKVRNEVLNHRCGEITQLFAGVGFRSCILKGQGNALMYPVPESRTPGDIDVWVYSKTNTDCTDETDNSLRRSITKFVKGRCPNAFEQYHHIDFPIFKDVEVEVHYTPGQLLSPKYNRRFQQYCKDYCSQSKGLVDYKGFRAPSIEFNAVYQMVHIMIHFFIEGIGLRHFVDYYYVLRGLNDKHHLKSNADFKDTRDIKETLRWLGMERFARGVMWIEQYCLGLEDKYLLIEPSENYGGLILKEMEEGGNFGHHDERYTFRKRGLVARGVVDTARLFLLAMVFPSGSFWKIARKIENQKWKLMKRYKSYGYNKRYT